MATVLAIVTLLSLLVHPVDSNDPCAPGGIALTGESSGVFSSPNFPGPYPSQKTCIWNITIPSGRIKITFFNFTLEPGDNTDCSGDAQGARLIITNVAHSTPFKLCGRSIPDPVYSLADYLGIQLFTGREMYSGFNASYETITEEMLCPNSSQLTDTSGVITSAFYPRKYPSNQDCHWEIIAAKGNHVKLEVKEMNIHECGQSGACACDYLDVLDGFNAADGAPSGIKCGDGSSLTYYSTHERLRVRFFSDLDPVSGKGFTATYTQLNYTPPECPAAPIPLSGNGTFSSLNYPVANYPPLGKNCYWLITASVGKRVKVIIKDFQMSNCDEEYCKDYCGHVDFHDGPSANSSYLARYCSLSVPTAIISSGRQMYVKFYSSFLSGRGFLAEYSETTDEPSPTVTRPPTTKPPTTTSKPPTTGAAVLTITLFLVILPSFAATVLSP